MKNFDLIILCTKTKHFLNNNHLKNLKNTYIWLIFPKIFAGNEIEIELISCNFLNKTQEVNSHDSIKLKNTCNNNLWQNNNYSKNTQQNTVNHIDDDFLNKTQQIHINNDPFKEVQQDNIDEKMQHQINNNCSENITKIYPITSYNKLSPQEIKNILLKISKITIFQTFAEDVNLDVMELLLVLDILQRNLFKIQTSLKFHPINLKQKHQNLKKIVDIKISYLGYGRQDKNLLNKSFGNKVILQMLDQFNNIINQVSCFDLHSQIFTPQSSENKIDLKSNIKNIEPIYIYQYILNNFNKKNSCIVLPDEGCHQRLKNIIQIIQNEGFKIIYAKKSKKISQKIEDRLLPHTNAAYQLHNDATIYKISLLNNLNKIYDNYIIIDDIVSSGKTIKTICDELDAQLNKLNINSNILQKKSKFILICSHMLYFAVDIKNILQLSKIVTTNSINIPSNWCENVKNTILSKNQNSIDIKIIDIFENLFNL